MRRPEAWPTDSPAPSRRKPTFRLSGVSSHASSSSAVMLTASAKARSMALRSGGGGIGVAGVIREERDRRLAVGAVGADDLAARGAERGSAGLRRRGQRGLEGAGAVPGEGDAIGRRRGEGGAGGGGAGARLAAAAGGF